MSYTNPLTQPVRRFDSEADKFAWAEIGNGWVGGLAVRDPETGRKVRVDGVDHILRHAYICIDGGKPQAIKPAELLERYGILLREAAKAAEADELEEMRAAGMIADSHGDDAQGAGSVERHLRQDVDRLTDIADASPSDDHAQQAAHDALMRLNHYRNADLHGNDRGLVLRDLLDHYTELAAFGDGPTQDRAQPVILSIRDELWDLEKGEPRDLARRNTGASR